MTFTAAIITTEFSKMRFIFLCCIFYSVAAAAQEHSELSIEYTVPDVVKLEAKAIAILRAPCTKPGCVTDDIPLTLAEAREKVRIDGKTNIPLCVEYIVIDALSKITQATVTATTQQRVP